MPDNDDFLTQMVGTSAPTQDEPETPEPEVEAPEPEGVKEPVKEPEAAPPAANTEKEGHVPLAALMAERDKRKEAARKAEELEKRLQAMEEANKKPVELPDFYREPEKYVQTIMSAAEARAKDTIYAALEDAERDKHEDFDDVLTEVLERAKSNPDLGKQILGSRNPAATAYKLGKELKDFDRMKDPAAYRESLKAELLAEIQAGLKAEEAKKAEAAEAARRLEDSIPPDLSSERSAVSSPRPRNKSTAIDKLFPKT